MEYHGRLYGKIGHKYFDTGRTSTEFDAMQERIIELEFKLENITNKSNWIEFVGNEDLFGEATLSNCMCRFDDGTECHYNDNHPMAILTHFQNFASSTD